MKFLTADEVLSLHRRIMLQFGDQAVLRDHGALLSSIAQPQAGFEGKHLYESLEAKAAALGYSLVMNHPFIDGNKRIGHAAMEAFLLFNGLELTASAEEAEAVILDLASGNLTREHLLEWIRSHSRASQLG